MFKDVFQVGIDLPQMVKVAKGAGVASSGALLYGGLRLAGLEAPDEWGTVIFMVVCPVVTNFGRKFLLRIDTSLK